jgi:RimJ/RimL family protein N-acetyltransferase
MPEAKLAALLADPAHHVHFLKHQGRNIGLSEIHVSEDGDVEIVYFGIESNYTGQGLGPIMMAATLLYAWQLPGVQRVWLHTSTNDHPMAQTFYKKIGFVPFKTSIDQFKDPRLAGHYPRDAGKHIPLCDATHAC